MGKCAYDVSAQSERHKNGSGETYRLGSPRVELFSVTRFLHLLSWGNIKLDALWKYTGLPVVRVTQKQKGLSLGGIKLQRSRQFFQVWVLKTI